MSNWIDVVAIDDFKSGTCRVVKTDEVEIAVFNIDGRYYAIDNLCSHEEAELSTGKLERDEIICPLHGAHFSLVTGEALTAPAYENIRTYPVRVNNGWLEVDTELQWDVA
nr:nitrite reductase small subunit NirD [uncultured Methylotenera sp.]